ncbi:hypothetical protein Lser_V15G13949 [Lactuca serriola]
MRDLSGCSSKPFIVPELVPDVQFSYASHKVVTEYKEAKAVLELKATKGVEKTFDLLSLLDKILPIYKEMIDELKEAGVIWIHVDEATLVKDLEGY